jgi:Ca2+-binding EF-hand superfamily protein
MSIRRKATALISEEDLHRAMEESLKKREAGKISLSHGTQKAIELKSSKWRRVFDELDLDKDGLVGKEEFRVCLALIGQPVREETLNLMIKLGDKNGDGMIDFDEFHALMNDPRPRIEKVIDERRTQSGSIVLRKPGTIVSAKNGDEQKKQIRKEISAKLAELSQQDLARMDPITRRLRTIEIVHGLIGIDTIKPKDIKVLHKKFQDADNKKVGKLSLFQFEKIFDSYNFIENRRLKTNFISLLFSFCDTDSSGVIDAKEFIIGLCWLSDFGNIDKLRFAFMLFDANGNGKMDREELVQLIASVNMGRDSNRAWIAKRVDEIFRNVAHTESWRDFELSFEQLVSIAEKNPDLFESITAPKSN